MRRWRTSGLVLLVGVLASVHVAWQVVELWTHGAELAATLESSTPSTKSEQPASESRTRVDRAAPKKAYDLLERLQQRQGEPLPGYVGGREFQNRERRLPKGRYREYDVNPKLRGRPRDAERIVIEQRSGKAYYTGDHYRTFTPLN